MATQPTLHESVTKLYFNHVRSLLQRGDDINSLDKEDRSPLILAIELFNDTSGDRYLEKLRMFRTILNNTKLKIDQQCLEGNTALHFAAKINDKLPAIYLINKGANASIDNFNVIKAKDLNIFVGKLSFFRQDKKMYKQLIQPIIINYGRLPIDSLSDIFESLNL